MSISDLFKRLKAPLTNTRWSWGAQRRSDGAIFLRVWQDLKFIEDGRIHMMIGRAGCGPEDFPDNPGHRERQQHLAKIRAGAPCFLIMCTAVDPQAKPRKIEFFNDDDVFVGGDLVERDGEVWIQIVGRRPVSSLVPR